MKKPFAKQQIIAVTMALLLSTAAHANSLINNANTLSNNHVYGGVDNGVNQELGDGSTAELDVGVLEANDGSGNNVESVGLNNIHQVAGQGSYVRAEVGKIRAKTAIDNDVRGFISDIDQQVGDNSRALIQVGVLDAGANGTAINNTVIGETPFISQGRLFHGGNASNASFKARIGVIAPSH